MAAECQRCIRLADHVLLTARLRGSSLLFGVKLAAHKSTFFFFCEKGQRSKQKAAHKENIQELAGTKRHELFKLKAQILAMDEFIFTVAGEQYTVYFILSFDFL